MLNENHSWSKTDMSQKLPHPCSHELYCKVGNEWKGLQVFFCLCSRAPPCGEAVNTAVWEHTWQLLHEQRPVHASGGHQWIPLQVRLCDCVSVWVCVFAAFKHHVWSGMTHLLVLQVWEGLLRPQMCPHGARHSANGRGADRCHYFLRQSADCRLGRSPVLLLQMVRPCKSWC